MHSSVVILAAFICTALAQVSVPPGYKERYPKNYPWAKIARHRRDVTWNEPIGESEVFRTLDYNKQGLLLGEAGYKETIFNDDRGKLDGEAYSTRVLGLAGDSSNFEGENFYSMELS